MHFGQYILTCGGTHKNISLTTCEYALSMRYTKCIVPRPFLSFRGPRAKKFLGT